MVKIGDKIKIISDNDTYNKYRGKTWTVDHIARSKKDHPGYDIDIGGVLVDAKGLPFSLYAYEFKVVKKPKKK
jgi:hypothetical protein